MREEEAPGILERLERLRTELIESAYALDSCGQHQAADVAMTTSTRLGELCAEFDPGLRVE